ncbi:MAG: hypothetical protein D6704_08210 [Nitrospirae bacterium]|nr:MAG: hypothetical protein D6704_08210 [Nitrospirota bacterium]
MNIEKPSREAQVYLQQLLRDLEAIRREAANAVNAVLAQEQFRKWKKQAIASLEEKIGVASTQQLAQAWLHTAYPGGDLYEELADDIEMCIRHVKKLLKTLESQGISKSTPPS